MAGYIGTGAVPQATQKRDSFTATAGQTSFPTSGYTPGFVDVYMNGVKLAPADFTATNSSDVVLAVAAVANDTLEIISYSTFDVSAQTFTGDVTASGGTFLPTGDTSAGDAAAMGYAAADGLVLTGQGSTSDVTIKNDADATVMSIPTGTTGVTFSGSVTATGASVGALARGAIQVGNSSGVAAAVAKGSAGTVLTSDGTDISWAAAGGGADIQTFTSSGTWTKPSSGTLCIVYVAGGGGGGGRVTGISSGQGLGSVITSKGILASNMPSSFSVTIGAGGAGSTSYTAAGSNGGTSSAGAILHSLGGNGGPSYSGGYTYPAANVFTATQQTNNITNLLFGTSMDYGMRGNGGRGGSVPSAGTNGIFGTGGNGQGGDGVGIGAGGAGSDTAGGEGTSGLVTIITF